MITIGLPPNLFNYALGIPQSDRRLSGTALSTQQNSILRGGFGGFGQLPQMADPGRLGGHQGGGCHG
jgi:hypothetical protein